MKVRVTLLTENDKYMECSQEKCEEVVKQAWEYFCKVATRAGDVATIEKVEVLER